ncbi:MAG: hypothetical protein AAFX76_00320 [Planctomycetota bacterium]
MRLGWALVLVVLTPFASGQPLRYVWWEAESADRHTFPADSHFASARLDDTSHLSGNDWLSSTGPSGTPPPGATYRLAVPAAGRYQLWARKFWKHGPFHWRFNQQPWQTLTRDAALTDRVRLADRVELSWVYLGDVGLTAGDHTFELRLAVQPGENTVSGFDCFVLSRGPFFPRGVLKPDQPAPADPEPGWFAFDPPLDPFAQDAPLDLRHLNEPIAGLHGRVRRTPAGDELLLGDGTPVRFWGVNVSQNQTSQPDPQVDHMARRMAKLGVNMVRHHGPIWLPHSPGRLDARRLDRLHHAVAACKRHGIYTNLSWYFPVWIDDGHDLGLAGYADQPSDQRKPFAVLFFNEQAQQHYFDTLRELLTTPNPYTGLTLAEDPAVALVELCNEDNLFFWTFNRKAVPPEQWQLLERKFGEYLAEKYGSLAAALQRWPKAKHERDDVSRGRAGVNEAWTMTREALADMNADERDRTAEQVGFLAKLQRGFYERAGRFLRDELGYTGLTSAGNWYPADPTLMDAVERWTYTAADVIDRHGYFNPKHQGDGASYSVRLGHTYQDRPAVREPVKPPLRTIQVASHPQIISELGWSNPNAYRADATLLTAAATATQGLDGVFFFIWNMNSGVDTVTNKFPLSTPVVAGSFPAMALMVRRGDLPPAPVAVHEALRTEDLFDLEGTAASTDAAFDAFRAADVPPGTAMPGNLTRFDPLSAWAGRVTRSYDAPGDRDRHLNLRGAIDRPRQTIRNLGGGFTWDYGLGVAVVDAPRCVAAAGFLADAGPIVAGPVTIDSNNHYAQVAVIALDDRPIAVSRRLLIQAVTEEKLQGFAAPDGTITDLGRPPWNLKRVAARVTLDLTDAPVRRVVALDGNGQATADAVTHEGDGVTQPLTVTLPPDRLYTVIER